LGALSYQWQRNSANIGGATDAAYTLVQDDIGSTVTVTVSAANTEGSVMSNATSTVAKASQDAPALPELDNKTDVRVALKAIAGAKYAMATVNVAPAIPDGAWQDSREFTGLSPNAAYYFFAYYVETATHKASPASVGLQVTMSNIASLINLTAEGLEPPFDPDVTAYAATLPCGANSFTVTATPNEGSTVTYLLDNAPATLPLLLTAPRITTLVVRVTAKDGVTAQDYTVAVARPFDASIIRARWDDVLAVNLNTATNGGYVFTGFQWMKNGRPMAGETTPYLYLSAPPAVSDRYNVLLTAGGQTLSVCRDVQFTPAAAPPAGLLAYPNPARHAITLENPQWETARHTDLINLSGNVVRSYPSARMQTLNVSGLPVGVYILRAGAHTVNILLIE
jgi:hypothetical protein